MHQDVYGANSECLVECTMLKDASNGQVAPLQGNIVQRNANLGMHTLPLQASIMDRDALGQQFVPLQVTTMDGDVSRQHFVPLQTTIVDRDVSSQQSVPLKTTTMDGDGSGQQLVNLQTNNNGWGWFKCINYTWGQNYETRCQWEGASLWKCYQ